jgi:hypothetical protein
MFGVLFLATTIFAGCRTERRGMPLRGIGRDPLAVLRNEKIAVVSLNHDPRVREKLESFVAGRMREHGLDARERERVAPGSGALSREELRRTFARAGMTYSFEIDYKPDETMPDGTPKTFESAMTPLTSKSPPFADMGISNEAVLMLIIGAVK